MTLHAPHLTLLLHFLQLLTIADTVELYSF